jgi:hypothetical protein
MPQIENDCQFRRGVGFGEARRSFIKTSAITDGFRRNESGVESGAKAARK